MNGIGDNITCRVCGNNEGNSLYRVKECMFGTGEEFDYFECSKCGCLQIKDLPPDMSRYYPNDYYSFRPPEVLTKSISDGPLARFLRAKRTQYMLQKKGLIGAMVSAVKPAYPKLAIYVKWFSDCGCGLASKILDVGCGCGEVISELAWYGFKNLTGIDPYIENDITLARGFKVYKKEIAQEDRRYDMIMLHHSFEHMQEPLNVLRHLKGLMNEDATLLIRAPTTSSYAWRHYRQCWVQIDAPRHIFLHSVESIKMLAAKAGLEIKDLYYDSTDFQFWGSEQCKRGITIHGKDSFAKNPNGSIFTSEEIDQYKERAEDLNVKRDGDSICVYMKKGSS